MRLKVSNVCQLLDKSKYSATQTINGVTFTNNGDGTFTVNGTNNGEIYYSLEVLTSIPVGHKVIIDDGNSTLYFFGDMRTKDNVLIRTIPPRTIFTLPSNLARLNMLYFVRYNTGGVTYNNELSRPQLFDLTEMYGAGNEPTTVAQFRQDFPNEMYEYSPVCWKKFSRLKYVMETKNLFKFSDEVGTLTGGFGPNVARNFEEDKWYIGFTTNNYYSPNNIIAYRFEDNLIYYNGNGAGYGLSRAFKCEPNSNYNISCLTIGISGSGLGYIYAGFYDESGNYISNNNIEINNRSFTTPASCKWLIITLSTRGTAEVYFKDIQLELGSTATPYQPYGYLPLNRGKYIANKEPVQLLDKSKYPATQTMHGVTFTNNGDGTITVNGTNNGEIYYSLEVLTSIPVGHKVIIDDGNSTLYFFGGMWTKDNVVIGTIRPRTIFTLPSNLARLNMLYFVRYNTGGVTYNNELSRPQLFDLTAMYGAGNEPTTVEQFRADFPNELYDYNPYNAITFR